MPGILSHEFFGTISIALSILAVIPYLWGIYRRRVRPHLIGWLIWSCLTAIVFFAQLSGGGGYGAWTTGVICAFCIVALIASFFFGDKSVTSFDLICVALTALAVLLWLISGTPLYSVILATIIEFLGFVAMTKKTYLDPYSESLTYFILSIAKYAFGALALEAWSMQTALHPVATAIMCLAFCLMIGSRRMRLPNPSSPPQSA
ncbi:MAG: hypothetical protein WCD70_10930 [Alphaproteobacteria bacterium]